MRDFYETNIFFAADFAGVMDSITDHDKSCIKL